MDGKVESLDSRNEILVLKRNSPQSENENLVRKVTGSVGPTEACAIGGSITIMLELSFV